ncbi:MAG: FMN-binding protein [Acidimicrobiales bacterium]
MASLLRRGLPALVLAGTGGALLARFDHTEALTIGTESTASTNTAAAPSTAAPRPTAPSTSRPSPGAPTPAAPSTTRPSTATPPPTTAPAAPAACTGVETLGPVVQTRWGPVQVAAVISQGKICDVRAVVVPSSHTRSTAINSRAVPILRQRVLVAQGAAFDTVSGATVTSDGYRTSLQAILNAAK